MLKCIILLEPEMFLLSIVPNDFRKEIKHIIIHVTTAARIMYPQMWKNMETPTVEMLVQKIYEIVEMDVLTERIRNGEIDRIRNIWGLFYKWLDEYYYYS